MIIILIIMGLILIGFATYLILRTKQLNEKGVDVNVTITSCEEIEKEIFGRIIKLGYNTNLNLEYEGNVYSEKIRTSKFYEVGSIQQGRYIHTGKQGNIYLKNDSFYNGSVQGGMLVLYLSVIPFLIALIIAAPINQEIWFALLFIYLLALLALVKYKPNLFSRFKYDNPESAQGMNLWKMLDFRKKK